MKDYTEYTRDEKKEIVSRGGDKLVQLEKAISDWLFSLKLPEDVRDVIAQTNPLSEVFWWCETENDVIEEARS